METIRLTMNGACGRMGRMILKQAYDAEDIEIAGAVELPASTLIGEDIGTIIGVGTLGVPVTDGLADAIKQSDVVIDFSWPESVMSNARACAAEGAPLVIGTTGLTAENQAELAELFTDTPCVAAPNMSVGVNLLFKIVAEAARILGDSYDVEISEIHHRFKKDAPSGTALRLAESVADALGRDLDTDARHGRHGLTGERDPREIGIHALRMGDVVGEHTVTFATIGERIEFTHKAQSREAFAQGAIRAARFVVNAEPGVYDMMRVLGL